MRKKMRRTYPRKQGMEYIHGGNKMLKLSLKQGQYVNIGDNIRVVYVGGSGNHASCSLMPHGNSTLPEVHGRKSGTKERNLLCRAGHFQGGTAGN